MKEFELKYGCNPNQLPAKLYMKDGSDLPVTILNGRPGYINFLDALNSWQLVKELKEATGLPAAASFKHVSPAGAAVAQPLTETLRKVYHLEGYEMSPLASAYARARGADRMSSFGDFVALSDVCDVATAKVLQHEVSDGVIAPGYDDEALAILKTKKKGRYNVIQIDSNYVPHEMETKEVFGVTFEQRRNADSIGKDCLQKIVTKNKDLPEGAQRDLTIDVYLSDDDDDVLTDGIWETLFTEKPERMTREERRAWIAQNKDVALGSDAFFPFGDNVERAHRSGVRYIAQAGGSIRDDQVIETADKYGIVMCFTGRRLFHH